MNKQEWGAVATDEIVKLRAGGRNRYNAHRQLLAEIRQQLLVDLIYTGEVDMGERGWQTRAAEKLGVSRSTISRDHQRIWRLWLERKRQGRVKRPSQAKLEEDERLLLKYREFWQDRLKGQDEGASMACTDLEKEAASKQLTTASEAHEGGLEAGVERVLALATRVSSKIQLSDSRRTERSEDDSLIPRRIGLQQDSISWKLFDQFERVIHVVAPSF